MIVRLYANKDELQEVEFHGGLNVVIGEIHLEKDRDKDTHNLGKSTLCQLIDFCLLRDRSKDFFLFEHENVFGDFVFFLELQLPDGRYLTIRRGVRKHSKISFHVSEERGIDARDLADGSWTHSNLPFEKAKALVDGLLSYGSLAPWPYRKVMPYLLRGQTDFNDVFRPSRFRGKDREWKPFLLNIMGFDHEAFTRRYDLEGEIAALETQEGVLAARLAGGSDDSGELDALIAIRQKDVNDLQKFLDDFKLEPHDKRAVTELVNGTDEQIARLNDRRYELRYSISQIEKALDKERMLFSTSEAKKLFEEAGILFEGQIERSYDQLLSFNRDITEERRSYLTTDLKEAQEELKCVEKELEELDERRSKLLRELGSEDVVAKYKAATDEQVERRTELESLKNRREQIRELQHARRQIAEKKAALTACDAEIRENIDFVSDAEQDGIFSQLRGWFDGIVYRVVGQHGMLSVSANKEGHAEPRAEILNKSGMSTNQDEGATYRKLLCIAFDLALILAHDGKGFPTFVYHDDVLGSLDNRKRENLRDVMRSCANRGVQQIVTVIDSDLPSTDFFDEDEVVLRLNDEGDMGRLFKMAEW